MNINMHYEERRLYELTRAKTDWFIGFEKTTGLGVGNDKDGNLAIKIFSENELSEDLKKECYEQFPGEPVAFEVVGRVIAQNNEN